jgi:hypothetical protein
MGGVKLRRYPWFQMMYTDVEITLEAKPAFGYRFDYWGLENPGNKGIEVYDTNRLTKVKADKYRRLTACFSQIVPGWLIAVIITSVVTPLLFLRCRKRKVPS